MRSNSSASGYRAILLCATLVLGLLGLLAWGPLPAVVILALGVTAAIAARKGRQRGIRPHRRPAWQPTIDHPELPKPLDDPIIAWEEPQVDTFLGGPLPLAHLPLPTASADRRSDVRNGWKPQPFCIMPRPTESPGRTWNKP